MDFKQGHLLSREGRGLYQADYLRSIDREIPDWVKIPLLGEAETAIRLVSFGLVTWLNKSDSNLAGSFSNNGKTYCVSFMAGFSKPRNNVLGHSKGPINACW